MTCGKRTSRRNRTRLKRNRKRPNIIRRTRSRFKYKLVRLGIKWSNLLCCSGLQNSGYLCLQPPCSHKALWKRKGNETRGILHANIRFNYRTAFRNKSWRRTQRRKTRRQKKLHTNILTAKFNFNIIIDQRRTFDIYYNNRITKNCLRFDLDKPISARRDIRGRHFNAYSRRTSLGSIIQLNYNRFTCKKNSIITPKNRLRYLLNRQSLKLSIPGNISYDQPKCLGFKKGTLKFFRRNWPFSYNNQQKLKVIQRRADSHMTWHISRSRKWGWQLFRKQSGNYIRRFGNCLRTCSISRRLNNRRRIKFGQCFRTRKCERMRSGRLHMVNRRNALNMHIQFGRNLWQVLNRSRPWFKGMTSKRLLGSWFNQCCRLQQRAKR